jgi:hypothetical protein
VDRGHIGVWCTIIILRRSLGSQFSTVDALEDKLKEVINLKHNSYFFRHQKL